MALDQELIEAALPLYEVHGELGRGAWGSAEGALSIGAEAGAAPGIDAGAGAVPEAGGGELIGAPSARSARERTSARHSTMTQGSPGWRRSPGCTRRSTRSRCR